MWSQQKESVTYGQSDPYVALCFAEKINKLNCIVLRSGVLCHMQQYFSYICEGTDVQGD